MNPAFTAFTEAEHRERLDWARVSLEAAGFDACVSVAAEHQFYLGGYDSWVAVNSPQALVFMADGGEPTLVMRNVDLSLALETTWVEDIRTYHLHTEDAAGLIAAVARRRGWAMGGSRSRCSPTPCRTPSATRSPPRSRPRAWWTAPSYWAS